MPVTPVDLLGTWALTRVVVDHRAGERRDVTGTATLATESPDRVRWTEEGTMSWPGHEVPIGRTLYAVRTGDDWEVRFEDGRTFHPWRVGTPVEHPCTPDLYRGDVETTGDPVETWTVTWDASGPEKDYRMVSVYSERR